MNKFEDYAFSEEPHLMNLAVNGTRQFLDTCYVNSDCSQYPNTLSCCWGNYYAYNPTYGYTKQAYQQTCDFKTCNSSSSNMSAG